MRGAAGSVPRHASLRRVTILAETSSLASGTLAVKVLLNELIIYSNFTSSKASDSIFFISNTSHGDYWAPRLKHLGD